MCVLREFIFSESVEPKVPEVEETPLKEISLHKHLLHDKLTGFGKRLCEGLRKREGVTDEY